ncbi:DUF481 domain-containing protein [Aliiglaciecola lipolytica]|uniref:Salt-induced outer membrane protein n=1 Tax=Aliiglaciecola lipolytica E3 TaxID=1127673 RepID=K6Y4K5_9ALTE|nr:DUF481 domain-containing protein [Aliiglaciecola lipolytica]GAC13187.1 hypothetical protein GLIP_0541 [Aliiglaciecola lipolytica E3]
MKKSVLCSVVFCALSANVSAEETKPFTMDGEFGLIVTTGNTETTSVKGKLSAHQELEDWSNDFIIEGLYKKDQVTVDEETVSQTTAQKWFVSGQANYKLENPDHRLFGFASYEDDRFSSYEYQSTIAAGWNQKLWDTDTTSFEYSIGPGYSYAKTEETVDSNGNIIPSETEKGLIVRAAMDYQWQISDTATFKQLLSTEVGEDNTKSKSVTSLSAKINGSLSMKFTITLDHNSDVAETRENLDTQSAITLVYTFF